MTENFSKDPADANETSVSKSDQLAPPTIEEIEEFLKGLPTDSYGLSRLDSEQLKQLEVILNRLHLTREALDDDALQERVALTQQLIQSGEAEGILANLSFIDRTTYSGPQVGKIVTQKPIHFDPSRINGASRFGDWRGREPKGRGEVAFRGERGNRTSLEAIYDYATRTTPLPAIDIEIFLAEGQNPIVFASDEHRAAAAKLRNEPIAVDSIYFYELE